MECTKDCEEIRRFSAEKENFIKSLWTIMEELDISQLAVEGNAFDAINSSDTSLNLVKDGILCIDQLIERITLLHHVAADSKEKMDKLTHFSGMIADFANVIGGISNRTNNLSLNASIEAAKAGEAGVGFYNIASEIRELAVKSSKSSNDIAETIQLIQEFIYGTVEAMGEIHRIVEKQNSMVSDVKTVLQKILEAAHISNDVSRNMEHEIAYQRDITDSVKKTVENIINKEKAED